MSAVSGVLGNLNSMGQLQLLLAFIACTSYAFAQGGLLPQAGRNAAWTLAGTAAAVFTVDSVDWAFAAVTLGFGVAVMGTFAAAVWLMSRALGLAGAALHSLPELVPIAASNERAANLVAEAPPYPAADPSAHLGTTARAARRVSTAQLVR